MFKQDLGLLLGISAISVSWVAKQIRKVEHKLSLLIRPPHRHNKQKRRRSVTLLLITIRRSLWYDPIGCSMTQLEYDLTHIEAICVQQFDKKKWTLYKSLAHMS